MKILHGIIVFISMCVLVACTQNPVQVTYKGQHSYERNNMQMANVQASKPIRRALEPATYVEPVAVAPVQTRELAVLKPAAPVKAVPVETMHPARMKSSNSMPVTVSAKDLPAELPVVKAAPTPQPRDWANKAESKPFGTLAFSSKSAVENKPRFIWPVRGKLVSEFGPKKGGLRNDGINIAAPEGEPVFAAANGVVVYAGNELPGYGNMIILRHQDGWMTAYAHTSGMMVKKDEQVAQGDLIGYVGTSGSVKTAQLHFGVREGKKAVNPLDYLSRDVAELN